MTFYRILTFLFLIFALTFLMPGAQAANFSARSGLAQVGGETCKDAMVTVQEGTIGIECKGFLGIRSWGVTTSLGELDNIRWEKGLFRGGIYATEKGTGNQFVIVIRRRDVQPMRDALMDRM